MATRSRSDAARRGARDRSPLTRRAFLTGIAATAGGAILAACGGGGATDTPKPAATNAPVASSVSGATSAATTGTGTTSAPAQAAKNATTIKYLTWWWAETGRNTAWRNLVSKFHAAQNDVRIQEVGFPFSEWSQQITTQLAGGGPRCGCAFLLRRSLVPAHQGELSRSA